MLVTNRNIRTYSQWDSIRNILIMAQMQLAMYSYDRKITTKATTKCPTADKYSLTNGNRIVAELAKFGIKLP